MNGLGFRYFSLDVLKLFCHKEETANFVLCESKTAWTEILTILIIADKKSIKNQFYQIWSAFITALHIGIIYKWQFSVIKRYHPGIWRILYISFMQRLCCEILGNFYFRRHLSIILWTSSIKMLKICVPFRIFSKKHTISKFWWSR